MRRPWLLTILLLHVLFTAAIRAPHVEAGTEAWLIACWPLAEDARDALGKLHGEPENIRFESDAAVFNGRDSVIHVADAEAFHLGTRDFSVGMWVKCATPQRHTVGDLLSKFDPIARQGLNFYLAGSSPGYNAMSDTRHVHFGIDNASLGTWEDCGKPCPSNTLITCLIAFHGELYCGIADADMPAAKARVFRYNGGQQWIDCGRLGDNPDHHSVQSMIVHQGKLYAGTGMWDWVQATGGLPGLPVAPPTRVFVYEGGTTWRDLGQVGDGTRVICLASFDGELYAGIDNSGDLGRGGGHAYRYDGKNWIDCGAPDGRNLECLLPMGGELYAATHRNVFRYDGGQSWTRIGDMPFGITQIHSMEAVAGKIVIGTWPQGYVLRHDGDGNWVKIGQLGLPEGQPLINEINDLTVYNGKLYAGTIPKAEFYRYEKDNHWTRLAHLAERSDWDPKEIDTWLRVTCTASFQGKLFAGTGSCRGQADAKGDPSLGRVYSIQAGQVVSHEHDIGGDWTHLVAVRHDRALSLYVNGTLSKTSHLPGDAEINISNSVPLSIGFGAQSHFHGKIRDVRLYGGALGADDVHSWYLDGDRRPDS